MKDGGAEAKQDEGQAREEGESKTLLQRDVGALCLGEAPKRRTQKCLNYSTSIKLQMMESLLHLLNPIKCTLLGFALLLSMQSNATVWNSTRCRGINKNLVSMCFSWLSVVGFVPDTPGSIL